MHLYRLTLLALLVTLTVTPLTSFAQRQATTSAVKVEVVSPNATMRQALDSSLTVEYRISGTLPKGATSCVAIVPYILAVTGKPIAFPSKSESCTTAKEGTARVSGKLNTKDFKSFPWQYYARVTVLDGTKKLAEDRGDRTFTLTKKATAASGSSAATSTKTKTTVPPASWPIPARTQPIIDTELVPKTRLLESSVFTGMESWFSQWFAR